MNIHGITHHHHTQNPNEQSGKLMSLPKGGVVINTSIGKI
jgi:hypothetical protein